MPQDTAAGFFDIPTLSELQVPAEILDTLEADDMANDERARLIDLLDVCIVDRLCNQISFLVQEDKTLRRARHFR